MLNQGQLWMDEVARYSAAFGTQVSVSGKYVLYEDYAKLLEEVNRLKLESEARRLRADANAAMFKAAQAASQKTLDQT